MQLFFDVREVVRTSSGLLNNARDWLEVLKSSKIFLQLRLSSEVVGKSSEVVGNIRRSSEVFRNLRQSSEDVDEKCHAFYWKKIGRYTPAPPCTMHLNTLTGPDLYTGLQWQIPSDGSNLRWGMALIDWLLIYATKETDDPELSISYTVSYWKQRSSTRDAGVRDTDLQLPSTCDPACLCTNTLEQRATRNQLLAGYKSSGDSDFQNNANRLLVIMFPGYTVQTMASNTSSRLLLTL